MISGLMAFCLLSTSPIAGIIGFSAAEDWVDDSAPTRQRIEIENPTSTSFENVPVLVKIDSTAISSKEAIRFYAQGSTQELPFEVENWNAEGTSTVWVQVPELAGNETAAIYGYYNGEKTQTSEQNVWNEEYVLVEHFSDNDFSQDSTGKTEGTVVGDLKTESSNMGMSGVFSGTQKIVYDPLLSAEKTFTIHAVIDPGQIDSWAGIVARDLNGGKKEGDTFFLGISGKEMKYYGRFYGTTSTAPDVIYNYSRGYQLLTLSFDGTNLSLYLNGEKVVSNPASGVGEVSSSDATPLVVGAYSDTGSVVNPFFGNIDEVQICTTPTSDDWETFRYQNYSGTCVTTGPLESRDGGISLTVSAPADGAEIEAGTVTLSGYVSCDAEITCKIGQELVSMGEFKAGRYSAPISIYQLGAQTIEVTATNIEDSSDQTTVSVHYTVKDTTAPSQPQLSDNSVDGVLPFGDAVLSAEISQDAQETVYVDFYEQKHLSLNENNTVVRQGSTEDALPTQITPQSGTVVEDFASGTVETVGENKNPYQIYTITLDEQQQQGSEFDLTWTGSSTRQVSAFVYDYAQSEWKLLDSGCGEDIILEMKIENKDVLQDGKLSVLIFRGLNQSLENRENYIVPADEYDFNIMWTSDTQFYSENKSGVEKDIMMQQFQWVIDNFSQTKSQLFINTGDLVNVAESRYQWENIDDAYKLVEDAGIPYSVITGNHDLGASDYYTQYFPASRIEANSPDFMGTKDNNYYYVFEQNGAKFLILALDMKWQQSDIEWANEILAQYPDHFGILLVHQYLTVGGDLDTGATQYANVSMLHDDLVAKNDNIRLILCGHNHGVNSNLEYFDGRPVYSILADYQGLSLGGLGYMRMLKFDVENDLIYVNTYSPYQDSTEYYTDKQSEKDNLYQRNKDEFVIKTELGGTNSRTLSTTGFTMSVSTSSKIGDTVTVKGPGVASVTWQGLEGEKTYSWYAVLTDEAGNTTQTPKQMFTVEPQPHIHQATHTPAQDATCSKAGNTEYWYCADCGKYFADEDCQTEIDQQDTVIPALNHRAAEHQNAQDATCTQAGNTEYWYCPDCGKYFTDKDCQTEIDQQDTVIPALNHRAAEHQNAQDATCTQAGNTEYWYCPDCGKYFADEDCQTEIDQQDTVIPAFNHDQTELKNAKDATCTQEGYTGDKVCTRCGQIIQQGVAIEKTAHRYQDGKCIVCSTADPDYKPTQPDSQEQTPPTSDMYGITMWVTLLFVFGGVLGATVIKKRRQQN